MQFSSLVTNDGYNYIMGYDRPTIHKIIVNTNYDSRYLEDSDDKKIKLFTYINYDEYYCNNVARDGDKLNLSFYVGKTYKNPIVSFKIFCGDEAVSVGRDYVGGDSSKISNRTDGIKVNHNNNPEGYHSARLQLLNSVACAFT